MKNSILIFTFVTLTWSFVSSQRAQIVDSGNIFDRLNPVRTMVGAQNYDSARLNIFNLPNRMIQGFSNIALAPWKGNDFSARGGKLPSMGNLFSGLSSFGGRGSRGPPQISSNYGPTAQVEMARAPGSGSGSASAQTGSGQNSGYPSGSVSASASASSQVNRPNSGFSSSPPASFFAPLSMPSAPGQGSSSSNSNRSPIQPNSGSSSFNSNQSMYRPSSPTTISASSPSANLPSIPTVSTATMTGTPSGSSSISRLPSTNFGPSSLSTSASSSGSNSGPSLGSSSGSSSSSINPAIAQALSGFGFNFGSGAGGQSTGASASIGSSNGQPLVSASANSGFDGLNTAGLGQAANYFSSFFG